MSTVGRSGRDRVGRALPILALGAVLAALAGCGSGGSGGGSSSSPSAKTSAGGLPIAAKHSPAAPVPGAARALRAAPGTWLLDVTGHLLRQPARMDFASDASLEQLRWRGWGSSRASASGRARLLSCEPDCADGKVYRRPARIRVSGLERCGRARFYGAATVTYRDRGRWRPVADYIRAPC